MSYSSPVLFFYFMLKMDMPSFKTTTKILPSPSKYFSWRPAGRNILSYLKSYSLYWLISLSSPVLGSTGFLGSYERAKAPRGCGKCHTPNPNGDICERSPPTLHAQLGLRKTDHGNFITVQTNMTFNSKWILKE